MPANPQEEDSAALESHTPGTLNLDKVLTDIGSGFFHNRLLVISGLGFSAVAVELVLTAFILPVLRNEWSVSEYHLAAVASIPSAIGMAGEAGMGVLADKFGRRPIFMLTVVVIAIFGIFTATSTNIWSYIAFRSVAYFCLGGNISIDYTVLAEFLSTQDRRAGLWKLQMFWPIGQLMAAVLARFILPAYGWRVFLLLCVTPVIVTACLRHLIPESPRWLLLNGFNREAVEVCRHIAILNNVNPEDLGLHPNSVLSLASNTTPLTAQEDSVGRPRLLPPVEAIFSKPYRMTTLGLFTFSAALKYAGYANLTFMPSMLEFKGWNEVDRSDFMIPITLAEIPGVLTFIFLSQYAGRLPAMKVSFFLIAIALVVFAFSDDTATLYLSIGVSTFFLEGCWGTFHVYVPEAYPTELRATAAGWIHCFGTLAGFGLPFTVAFIMEHFGIKSLCVFFSFCCAVGATGALLFLHVETADRDLEDRVVSAKS